MSLVSTYVQSQDDKWYKNPVIYRNDWFICWDDDDPIELVIRMTGSRVWDVLEELRASKWTLKVISRGHAGSRLFAQDFRSPVYPARAYFLRQMDNGPPDTLLSDEYIVDGNPYGKGTMFYNSPNGWNKRLKSAPWILRNLHSK